MIKKVTREEAIAILETAREQYANNCIKEAFDMAIEALKEQRPHSEWIPCSERLPDEDGDYLATYTFCDKQVVNKVHYSNHLGFYYDTVIAWMPLPEPYKRGEAE